MSQWSDYAENKLCDMVRGQAWTLGLSLHLGFASVASDSTVTELTGTFLPRLAVARNMTNWSGTQGAGTTIASSGTTHEISNNVLLDWGTASGDFAADANYVLFYDASSGGNVVCAIPLNVPLTVNSGDPVTLPIAEFALILGTSGGCSDYLANKLLDFVFRGQAYSFPANMYEALYTVLPTNAGGGTEVGGGVGYARVAVPGTLAGLSGTQAAGTTVASTGTSGQISNNADITFATPTGAGFGIVVGNGEHDASSGGNLLFWAALTGGPKTIGGGALAPKFVAGARKITFA